jgi:hypothetical protein
MVSIEPLFEQLSFIGIAVPLITYSYFPIDVDGIKRASKIENMADSACEDGDHHLASELYFEASKLYGKEGDLYFQYYCEAHGFHNKTLIFPSPEGEEEADMLFGLMLSQIDAERKALAHAPDKEREVIIRANILFTESELFNAQAMIEAETSRHKPSNEEVIHLRNAAKKYMDAATKSMERYDLWNEENDEYEKLSSLSSYHEYLSGHHYYVGLARIAEENWGGGIDSLGQAKAEIMKSIEHSREMLFVDTSKKGQEGEIHRKEYFIIEYILPELERAQSSL